MRWLLLVALVSTPALAGRGRSNTCKDKCSAYVPMCEGQCKELGGKHVKECNVQCAKVVGMCEADCEKKQQRKR